MPDLCHQKHEVAGFGRRGWPRKTYSMVAINDLRATSHSGADMTRNQVVWKRAVKIHVTYVVPTN